MNKKTAIILAATMALVTYVNDTVRVRLSIKPEPQVRELGAPAAELNLSAQSVVFRLPADGGTVELSLDRKS